MPPAGTTTTYWLTENKSMTHSASHMLHSWRAHMANTAAACIIPSMVFLGMVLVGVICLEFVPRSINPKVKELLAFPDTRKHGADVNTGFGTIILWSVNYFVKPGPDKFSSMNYKPTASAMPDDWSLLMSSSKTCCTSGDPPYAAWKPADSCLVLLKTRLANEELKKRKMDSIIHSFYCWASPEKLKRLPGTHTLAISRVDHSWLLPASAREGACCVPQMSAQSDELSASLTTTNTLAWSRVCLYEEKTARTELTDFSFPWLRR